MLTVGSLFAGMGGFDAAAERSGMRVAWQVEIDPQARRVLRRHWPGTLLLEDVLECGAHNLPPVDVITGGFPCQDLSLAGKRAGLSGGRSGLFYEMTRVAHELRPRFLVWENVPGLLSSDRGRDFARVLMELEHIGFHGCWTVLAAERFGLPQRRRRVFGVFARSDIAAGCCAEILALLPRCRRHPATGGTPEPGVAGSSAAGPGGNLLFNNGGRGRNAPGPPTVTAADDNGTNMLLTAPAVTPGARRASGNRGGEQVIAYQCCGNEVSQQLSLRSGAASLPGGVPFIVNAAESCARRDHARQADTARSLDSTGGFAANQGGTVVQESLTVRRLTPTEALRLQGFSDDHLDTDPPLSDGAKYRLAGNSVALPVVTWILSRLAAVAATEEAGLSKSTVPTGRAGA